MKDPRAGLQRRYTFDEIIADKGGRPKIQPLNYDALTMLRSPLWVKMGQQLYDANAAQSSKEAAHVISRLVGQQVPSSPPRAGTPERQPDTDTDDDMDSDEPGDGRRMRGVMEELSKPVSRVAYKSRINEWSSDYNDRTRKPPKDAMSTELFRSNLELTARVHELSNDMQKQAKSALVNQEVRRQLVQDTPLREVVKEYYQVANPTPVPQPQQDNSQLVAALNQAVAQNADLRSFAQQAGLTIQQFAEAMREQQRPNQTFTQTINKTIVAIQNNQAVKREAARGSNDPAPKRPPEPRPPPPAAQTEIPKGPLPIKLALPLAIDDATLEPNTMIPVKKTIVKRKPKAIEDAAKPTAAKPSPPVQPSQAPVKPSTTPPSQAKPTRSRSPKAIKDKPRPTTAPAKKAPTSYRLDTPDMDIRTGAALIGKEPTLAIEDRKRIPPAPEKFDAVPLAIKDRSRSRKPGGRVETAPARGRTEKILADIARATDRTLVTSQMRADIKEFSTRAKTREVPSSVVKSRAPRRFEEIIDALEMGDVPFGAGLTKQRTTSEGDLVRRFRGRAVR